MSNQKDIPGNPRELVRELLSTTPLSRWHRSTHKFIVDQSGEGTFAVACSGGADSTFALLLSYAILGSNIKVFHMNHALRGSDSDFDEEFVQDAQLAPAFLREDILIQNPVYNTQRSHYYPPV